MKKEQSFDTTLSKEVYINTSSNNIVYGKTDKILVPGINVEEGKGSRIVNGQEYVASGQAVGTYYISSIPFKPKFIQFSGTGGNGWCNMQTDGIYNNGNRVYWAASQIRSGNNSRILQLYDEPSDGYLLVDFASFREDGFAFNVIQADFGATFNFTCYE